LRIFGGTIQDFSGFGEGKGAFTWGVLDLFQEADWANQTKEARLR